MELRGSMPAMVTPMADGAVDEGALRDLALWQIEEGSHGLVPVGTTGESPTLSHAEHERVVEIVVEAAGGRVPVIAGAGSNNTVEAERFVRHAKDVGADAALVVTPYYNKPTQDGLYAHFAHLSEKVDIPIVLYNIPGRTGVTMQPETTAKLYANANIAGMKEATGDVTMATRLIQLCDCPVVSGDDPLALPTMAVGGRGVISVVSNVVPGRVARMCKLADEGNYAEAAKIHHALYPLTRSLFLDGNPAGVKRAMHLLGRDSGEIRLPLVPASEATVAAIRDALGKLGLSKGAAA